jgi:hypothetical protein
MRRVFEVPLLILFAGCATVTGPHAIVERQPVSTTKDFLVRIEQKNEPVAMPTAVVNDRAATPIDIDYAISITNRTHDPVTVRHITLKYRDPNRVAPRRTRDYSTTIVPGATEKFDFWLEVHTNDPSPYAPGILQSEIEFEAPQGKRLERFVTPVSRPST